MSRKSPLTPIAASPARRFYRQMAGLLLAWAFATAMGSVALFQWTRISLVPEPSLRAARWAMEALQGLPYDRPLPPPPAEAQRYRAAGPVFVTAWWRGEARSYYRADSLVAAVQGAARHFTQDRLLRALDGWARGSSNPVSFTLSVTRGTGPLVQGIPLLSSLALVPMVEGISAELKGRRVYLPPERLWAERAYDGAVATPLPDLTFGVDLTKFTWRLATELGVSRDQLLSQGTVRRFRSALIAADAYPTSSVRIDPETLRSAALEAARFLLRHQEASGRFTYIYDGAKDQPVEQPRYSLPRHAGSIYFLAQVGRLLGMAEARAGALRGLDWVRHNALRYCGGSDRPCVGTTDRPDVGSSALTLLAATELLLTQETPWVRELLLGLTRFLKSMQRPDGELMHVYDLSVQRPLDVQRLYFSGEAAFALLRAYKVVKNADDLSVARRLMGHLTGAGWSFFGSRYYYGEEHWTCQAVGEASHYMSVAPAMNFCMRWSAYNQKLQYRDHTTPWSIRGAYGVGPLLLPRLTPIASRTEAAIYTYQLARAHHRNTDDLRLQIDSGLEFLLRYRWAPGPAYLLANPSAARGGIPGSPVDLTVRNDFVQHAGSAMLMWAEIKARERADLTAGKSKYTNSNASGLWRVGIDERKGMRFPKAR